MSTYNPIYYEQNRKRILANQHRYQQAHKKIVNAKQRRYHAKHKLEISRRRKEKYKKLTVIHDMDEAAYGDTIVSKNKEKK